MRPDVVVFNGGSSSGKTSIARCMQDLLPDGWLRWSIDDLVAALPSAGEQTAPIEFASDGSVAVGAQFRRVEQARVVGIAVMARSGVGILLDDVFLDGGPSQERVRRGLGDVGVLWVGVHCDPAVAAARELHRADRIIGMAASQAQVVHHGVSYDIEVDTDRLSTREAAEVVLAAITTA